MALLYKKKNIFSEDDSRNNLFILNVGKDKMSFFPAEWYPQSGIQIAWPHINSDWAYIIDEVETFYIRLAFEIAKREYLLIVTPQSILLKKVLEKHLPKKYLSNIRVEEIETNDTWSRDNAFITVYKENKACLLDFNFNGWGQKFNSSLDNTINRKLKERQVLIGTYFDLNDFVLEGGSIECDGNGTLMTTTQCLLSKERNPKYNQKGIEERLKELLEVKQVLWLNNGYLEGDDTDGHIDTLARFCPNNTIVYSECKDQRDKHYEPLQKMKEELSLFRNAEGNPYQLVPLPLPHAIYANVKNGEIVETKNTEDLNVERLPATYANFLIMNKTVLYPTYNQLDNDKKVKEILQEVFPEYEIVGIDCLTLIKQHGSLHCATMQFPRDVLRIM